MTFRNSREHCGRLDCACSANRLSSFPRSCVRVLTAVIWRRSMELCLVVLLPRYIRGIRFCDFGVSGVRACRGESVVVGRRPDNVHGVWYSRLSTSKHSNTPCLRHIDVVFIGQLKLVNSFSNLAHLQLFYKYTCIVVSIYLMDHGRQLRNSPLRLDCCTQGLILFARSNAKHANRTPCQAYIRLKVDVMSRSVCDVTLKCIV